MAGTHAPRLTRRRCGGDGRRVFPRRLLPTLRVFVSIPIPISGLRPSTVPRQSPGSRRRMPRPWRRLPTPGSRPIASPCSLSSTAATTSHRSFGGDAISITSGTTGTIQKVFGGAPRSKASAPGIPTGSCCSTSINLRATRTRIGCTAAMIWLSASHTRVLLKFSRGGADATVVREFDVAEKRFVADGFTLPEGKHGALAWVDADTLLVSSPLGTTRRPVPVIPASSGAGGAGNALRTPLSHSKARQRTS